MVKEKTNSVRTYDEEGFRRRAACICVRSDAENEVLLINSSSHPDVWVIPGGGVEPKEDPSKAAEREVFEEAGVKGTLGRRLGIFENPEKRHRTDVYVLNVTNELDEWQESVSMGRKRKWFSIDEALSHLETHRPAQRDYLKHLNSFKAIEAHRFTKANMFGDFANQSVERHTLQRNFENAINNRSAILKHSSLVDEQAEETIEY